MYADEVAQSPATISAVAERVGDPRRRVLRDPAEDRLHGRDAAGRRSSRTAASRRRSRSAGAAAGRASGRASGRGRGRTGPRTSRVSCVHSAVIELEHLVHPRAALAMRDADGLELGLHPARRRRRGSTARPRAGRASPTASRTGRGRGTAARGPACPSRIVRVTPDSAASSVIGSSQVVRYAGGATSRWSMSIAVSKPRSSARRRYAPISASDAVCVAEREARQPQAEVHRAAMTSGA